MEINCTDYSLTQSIKNKINDFEDEIKKFIHPTENVHLTLSKEAPDLFRVDIQAYAFGKTIRSEQSSHDFHKAFKLGAHHFTESLKKAKDILKTRTTSQP